jgi:hypothetical protein
MIRDFTLGGDDILSLAESEAKKQDVQKLINFGKQNPATQNQRNAAFNEAMRSELMKSGDSLATYLEKLSGKNAGKFSSLKKSHGNIATAKDLAEEGLKKEAAKAMLDPIDKGILGLTAAPIVAEMFRGEDINGRRSGGNVPGSIALGLSALAGKKFGARHGQQGIAKILNSVQKQIGNTSEFIKNNPYSSQRALNQMQNDE